MCVFAFLFSTRRALDYVNVGVHSLSLGGCARKKYTSPFETALVINSYMRSRKPFSSWHAALHIQSLTLIWCVRVPH